MSQALLVIGGLFIAFMAFTLYACLVVGARADRQMELMMEAERQKANRSQTE